MLQWALLVLVVGLLWGTIRGEVMHRRMERLEARADSLANVARERRDSLTAVRSRTSVLLQSQRRQIDSLIAAVPRTEPSTAPERVRVMLDSVPLPPELTEAGRELLAYVDTLEAERDALRTLVQSFPSRLAARDSLWVERQVATDRARVAEQQVSETLRRALDAAKAAGTVSWPARIICGGAGAAVGSLAEPQAAGIALGALAGVGACAVLRR